MNLEDKVSVIIPSFERFEYLKNAIESVENQSYQNFEIIVINDGSKDERYYKNTFNDKVKFLHLETNLVLIHLDQVKSEILELK